MTLKGIIESKKLVIPRYADDSSELKLTDELVAQLVGFVKRESESFTSEIIDSTYTHDDIAISLSMAVREATRQITGDFFGKDEKVDDKFKEANRWDVDKKMEWDWNKLNQ